MIDKVPLDTQLAAESRPRCPVGESHCVVIDQVTALHSEIAHLAEQVRTDTLTGLYNFRHFRFTLEQEMERTRRTQQTTALIMVDLDYFKKVNDNWGHEGGNQALIATADVLRSCTRRLDIACRYGGEEFSIILPATDLITAMQVAERIREQVAATPVLIDGKTLQLTASLGVDIYTFMHDEAPEQFVDRADSCLYQAKQQGRNRVCHGGLDMGSAESAVSREERELLSGFFGDQVDD
ncbi:GGDEF domain-containing protein [Oceanicoccus sp. KOV_DT_Chl]|uniref:GGDEF domain-containing protein n=1 Tax=Oceanicoccus sp. KOV_DT_Chl TaxID=1904639 RepID=UPI000C7D3187|nr:GGDEF domain-containing protein [Oceanicoccus sp. KOV_DT_Chl]